MKPAHLGVALLVVSFLFALASAASAEYQCREDPNGGCLPYGAPTPTPRPSSATPRPSALTLVSNVCDHGRNYGHDIVTIKVTYSGATELWSNAFGIPAKMGSGTGTYTVTVAWDPSFNKADVKLVAPGTTWYWYGDEPQSYASLVVHYLACP